MSEGGPQADRTRVLLTGAAGYIGSHVYRALLAAGHEVIAVDNLLDSVHGINPTAPEGVSRVDIRNPEALEPLLRGVDVVCHLAAAVPVPDLPGTTPGRWVPPRPVSGRADKPDGPDRPDAAREPDAMTEAGDGDRPAGYGALRAAGGVEPCGCVQTSAGRREDVGHGAGPCVRGPADGGRESARSGPLEMQRAAVYATHNDAGTAVLLAAMERAGVRRLVLASSVAVYGEGRYRAGRQGPFFPGLRRRADLDRGLFDHRAPRTGDLLTWESLGEDAPLRPRSAYAASKVAQEHYALAWVASTGSAATVLRYHHVYGAPVDDGRTVRSAEAGVVSRFRADLLAGRPPRVFEDGGQVRDFVHVRDVAAATVAAVQRRLAGFVPLNIASGQPLTLWEVAAIMAKALDGPTPVVTGQYRITDIRHLVANPERARHALEFSARTGPGAGLSGYATTSAGR
ncbi:NAD-dependent epimerase/dehydratase family protein [Nocardia sp. NBC_01503]|uniref:NAD-dependent epimerase/dehydratase family protein n=1 Tax=Nocardia sp. NBC_01503 TaxID=2975997 RepID=UPI002E7B43D7|nr:NAD-dependent epimerase/dehydratase family protein [Nocardia sp. NBC_01503]WTL33871.1 NAD-dependent epimerase/dehydratase family protein [Nocardia sp. NBC_01503]